MKNVVKLSYLKRDFIRFETDSNDIRYLIYTREGSICSSKIDTIKDVIEQLVANEVKIRKVA